MAEKILIKNTESGEVQYPVTHEACILTENGSRLATQKDLDEYELPLQAKRAVFDDMWNAAVGSYGKIDYSHYDGDKHTPYYLNELWLTYDEAVAVMEAGAIDSIYLDYRYANAKIRTNLPATIKDAPTHAASARCFIAPSLLSKGSTLEIFRTPTNFTLAYFTQHSTDYVGCKVINSPYLKKILGLINCGRFSESNGNAIFGAECSALESVNLHLIRSNLTLSGLPKIDAESVRYMINNRYPIASGGPQLITVTLHPDIYAKITSEEGEYAGIMDLAESKNVSLASA